MYMYDQSRPKNLFTVTTLDSVRFTPPSSAPWDTWYPMQRWLTAPTLWRPVPRRAPLAPATASFPCLDARDLFSAGKLQLDSSDLSTSVAAICCGTKCPATTSAWKEKEFLSAQYHVRGIINVN